MIKNYFTIALRRLNRQRGYAAINIMGLAVGLACCILMVGYVQDELRYDRMHAKSERIYRIVEARTSPERGEQHFAYTAGPFGPALAAGLPEVSGATRLIGSWAAGRRTVGRGENRFYEHGFLFAEPSFFDVFDFDVVDGDPQTALDRPNLVVLSEEAASRYFGPENPLGRTLQMEQYGELTVTGVVRVPQNSHLDFTMLISFTTLHQFDGWWRWIESWGSSGILTYVALDEGASPEAVQAGLAAMMAENVPTDASESRRPYLQALTDIHFQSGHIGFQQNRGQGHVTYVYVFSILALLIVLIAGINYMNLATARSLKRAREVGMRKAVGARRGQLVLQFLGESVLTASIAFLLAMGIAQLALPYFNVLADKELTLVGLGSPVLAGLLGIALVAGIFAGSYPALYLSRFSTAMAFKGHLAAGPAASRLRRALVVTQFALSITLMIATVVVYDQLRYVQDRPLGFNQEQLVVVDINSGNVRRDFETVKREFGSHPSVRAVSVSSNIPGDWKSIPQIDVATESAPDTDVVTMHFLGVDEDFLSTFEMRLDEGRNFSHDFATDSTSVLLNQTAARMLGATLGGRVRVPAAPFEARVIGIVEDFHFASLHETIGPMMLAYRSNPIDVIDYFTVRVSGGGLPEAISHLQAVGRRFDPDHPFEYNLLDERLADFYATEQRVARIFGIAAGLAILIASLGLLGLAAFTAEQRTKEIGIRKVLGASVGNIVGHLSKDFLRLVLIAFVVAAPVAYLIMSRWLVNFAYRVELGPAVFLLAGGAAVAIALATVSFHAVRAALADPVESLRYE